MSFLPLTPPGETPLRVMTIAGSDSGGGAGIQADLRTFAMLGVHGLVAVTAVTVQNSVGVKGFHEIPLDVIAGQIEAVASDIGVQARYRWWSIRCARRCTATHCCIPPRWTLLEANSFRSPHS